MSRRVKQAAVVFVIVLAAAQLVRPERANLTTKFGELPILFAVLITGTILAVRAWPLTPLHFIKIAASIIAVGCALICTRWVFERRQIEDVNVLLGFRRRIWSLAAVAVVFATPALYLGLVYFRE